MERSHEKKNYKKIICSILGWSTSISATTKMSYPDTEMFHCISFTDALVGEIPIAIMDLISIRIKVQFREKFGLFPPSYIYAKICVKDILNENEMITSDIKAVQIHYINGHYLISCQLPPNQYVFDSFWNFIKG